MAEFIRISPASSALHRSRPPWIPPNSHSLLISSTPNPTSHANAGSLHCSSTGADRMRALTVSSTDEGPLQELESAPVAVKLLPICSEAQFDQVISEAQHLHEPLIVVWMASWCRKCIYLKPKLEKLAAEYHTRLRFFCVDVNNVSHKLVARAGITLPWWIPKLKIDIKCSTVYGETAQPMSFGWNLSNAQQNAPRIYETKQGISTLTQNRCESVFFKA
ncbi:hypothetical protein Dimus_011507 [Dionaea muscipula]